MQEEVTWIRRVDEMTRFVGEMLGMYRPRNHELAAYSALGTALGSGGKGLVHSQLMALNHWYRQCKGMYVVPIRRPGLKTLHLESKDRFPLCKEDHIYPMAVVHLGSAEQGKSESLRTELWGAIGQIYFMIFDKPPKRVFGRANPPLEDIRVDEVTIYINPMVKDACPLVPMQDLASLSGTLSEWHAKWTIRDVIAPISYDLQRSLVGFYHVRLPGDYLELVSLAERFTVGNCTVYGLASAEGYVTPAESYYVIGEIHGHGNLVLVRNEAEGIYYVDNEDLEPILVGQSLKQVIETALEEGVERWRKMPGLWSRKRNR